MKRDPKKQDSDGGRRGVLKEGVQGREVLAWSFFDFANSGYSTVVITAVFNAYFVSVVARGEAWGTLVWSLTLSASYLLVIVFAPIVGVFADFYRIKKKLLFISTFGCVLFTALLSTVSEGGVVLAICLVILSNFFFGTGENLIAAFLPELARTRALGKVSGWGWAFGYLGGLITLGICLFYLTSGFWIDPKVSATMFITASVFLLASLPTFTLLRERGNNRFLNKPNFLAGHRLLISSILKLNHFRDLKRFLFCLATYQAGVQAVIALAAIYAEQAMGFTTKETILLILVVNVTACIGALAFGYAQDKLGHKQCIFIILIGWLFTVVVAYASSDRSIFWLVANMAGLFLGSSQSAGRALIAYLSPAGCEAEFFSLWGIAVKISSILGPISYGVVVFCNQGDHRQAILFLGLFFILGLFILRTVNPAKGRRTAVQYSRDLKSEN